jgi:hypothetical protein
MKKLLFIFFPVLLISACQKSVEILPALTQAEISGDRLWKRISVEEKYADYPEWPDFEGMQIGQSPHGRYHIIHIHPVLRNALPIGDNTAPPGSIIVKENFDAEKNRLGYTVMAKVKDFNPATKDWFWASYDAVGKTLAYGNVDMCIRCHEGMKSNDYVIIRALDLPVAEESK